jgi:hypothetical protein
MKLFQLVVDPSHAQLAFVSEVEDPLYLLLSNLLAGRTLWSLALALQAVDA